MNKKCEIHDYESSCLVETASKQKRLKASAEQLNYLWLYMKKHPDIGWNPGSDLRSRVASEKRWLALANKLNGLKGTPKSILKWKQAWRDMRNNFKKETSNRKRLGAYARRFETDDPATSVQENPLKDPIATARDDIQDVKVFTEDRPINSLQYSPSSPEAVPTPEPLSSEPDHQLPEAITEIPIEMVPTEPIAARVRHANPEAGSSVVPSTGTSQGKQYPRAFSAHLAQTGSSAALAAGTGKGTNTTHHTAQPGSSVVQTTGNKDGENLATTGSLAASAAGTGAGAGRHTAQRHKTPALTGSSVVSSTGTREGNKNIAAGSSVILSTGTRGDSHTHRGLPPMLHNPPPKEGPRSVSPVASGSSGPAPGREGTSGPQEDAFSEGWQLPKKKGKKTGTSTGQGGKAAAEPTKPRKWKVRKTRKERRMAAHAKAESLPSATRSSALATRPEPQGQPNFAAGKRKLPPTGDKAREAKRRPEGDGQPSAKRALNETVSPRGESKRQKLDQTRKAAKSYAQAASTPLSVAVTCARTGRISKDVSEQVLTGIQKLIFVDALARSQLQPPKFKAKPLYTEGVLKLWCVDDHTRTWLQRAVADMELTASVELVVKSQSEISQRARCGILVPDQQGLLEDATSIGRVLSFQNPEVGVEKWTLLNAAKQAAAWFLVVGVPEDQVPALMKSGRRLAFGVGTVYLKFQGRSGKFTDVPLGWDTNTCTIRQELKTLPAKEVTEPRPKTPVTDGATPARASTPAPDNADGESAVMEEEEASISGPLGDDADSMEIAGLKLEGDEEGTTSDGVPFLQD